MSTKWVPVIDSRNTGNDLARFVELVDLCRRCIELCFAPEHHDHPIVYAAANSQMHQPGSLAYDWFAAQRSLHDN